MTAVQLSRPLSRMFCRMNSAATESRSHMSKWMSGLASLAILNPRTPVADMASIAVRTVTCGELKNMTDTSRLNAIWRL